MEMALSPKPHCDPRPLVFRWAAIEESASDRKLAHLTLNESGDLHGRGLGVA